ncbi:Ceramide glucosyltransferase, partial [Coemansia sp. S2]
MNTAAAHNSPSAGILSTITHAAASSTKDRVAGFRVDFFKADLVAYFVLVLAAFLWLLIIISHCVLQRRYVKPRPFVDRPAEHYPPVTIIRPLKGLDLGLRRTLESSFRQEYPGVVEILFAVEDPDDPAIGVANELIECYPKTRARVLIGQDNVGINPKINNMMKAFAQAHSDL